MKIEPKTFALSDYFGKRFPCSCGRLHSVHLKEALIERGALEQVPGLLRRYHYQNALMVCDQNTWEAAGSQLADILRGDGFPFSVHCFATRDLVPDEAALGAVMMAMGRDCDVIVAVGTGTLNDLCKYASFASGREYVIVATAPAMDGFASIGAPLLRDNMKTTFDAHTPLAIVGDTRVLCAAPMEMITAGLGDILGKYTCLVDWKLSHLVNGEYYCPVIAEMVQTAMARVLENAEAVQQRDEAAVKAIMEALVLTGIAMSFSGNSRPASGSEHHLSHYWEMCFLQAGRKPVLHGRKVAVGTVTVSWMYHHLLETPVDFAAARRNAADFDRSAWEQEMRRSFGKAAPGVIALENTVHKNAPEACLARLDATEANWEAIASMLRASLPETEALMRLLRAVGAPCTPQEVGVDRALLEQGVIAAKEVRDRYTLLQLLWDLGLLRQFSADVGAWFFEEEAD